MVEVPFTKRRLEETEEILLRIAEKVEKSNLPDFVKPSVFVVIATTLAEFGVIDEKRASEIIAKYLFVKPPFGAR